MQTITAQDVKHLWERGEDFLLVNTLPADKFAPTKIPGSVNIPESDDNFAARVLERAGSKEKSIVVYCANRQCQNSHIAAHRLSALGYTDVAVYAGGKQEWEESGLPLESSAPVTA